MRVEVVTPAGDVLAADDPALIRMLGEGISDENQLTQLRSDRAMTDCRPVSLIGLQTVHRIGEELGGALDPRRFRANIYMNFASARGFDEDVLVGRSLRLGASVVVSVLERDPRCKMISLDPDTGASDSRVRAQVSKAYEGRAGVYCAVLVEGTLQKGDAVELLD